MAIPPHTGGGGNQKWGDPGGGGREEDKGRGQSGLGHDATIIKTKLLGWRDTATSIRTILVWKYVTIYMTKLVGWGDAATRTGQNW